MQREEAVTKAKIQSYIFETSRLQRRRIKEKEKTLFDQFNTGGMAYIYQPLRASLFFLFHFCK